MSDETTSGQPQTEKEKINEPAGRARRKIGKTRPVERKATRDSKPWEPSATQLEIYAQFCSGKRRAAEIAEEFGIHRTLVNRTCQKIEKWLAPRMMDSIREIKCQHTQSLMGIFQDSMCEWERSRKPAITIRVIPGKIIPGRRKEDGSFEPNIVMPESRERTIKFQCGNPRYLESAMKALEGIREIWGANAPIKVEHSGELRVAGMTADDARNQLAAALENARGRLLNPKASVN